MNLGRPIFYSSGEPGASAVVGIERKRPRVARYEVVSPQIGASSVRVKFLGSATGEGRRPSALRCYIGTSSTSHASPTAESPYTCVLAVTPEKDYVGSADIILLPATRYYVWVFPDDFATYGWVYWSTGSTDATMEVSGAAASTVTAPSGTLGSPQTIRITRYSTKAVHTLTATCGSAKMTLTTGLQADSYTWTPPIAWTAQAPNDTSVSVKIACQTILDGKTVGTAYADCKMQIPGPGVWPSVTMALEDANGVTQELGTYVRSKSKLRVSLTAAGVYGSTITAYEITVGNVTIGRQTAEFDLNAAGQIVVDGWAKDSRGRWAKISQTITVATYRVPSAEIVDVYRCREDGNRDMTGAFACIVFNASVDVLTASSAKYMLQSRQRGTSAWTDNSLPQYDGKQDLKGAGVILPADPAKAFEFAVVASDRWLPARTSPYRNCPMAFALIQSRHDDKAIGIGAQAGAPETLTIGLQTVMAAQMAPAGFIAQAVISAGDDADNYRTPGLYSTGSNANAEQIANLPCKIGGLLWVNSADGSGVTSGPWVYLHQYYRPLYITEPTYRRSITSNGNGVWSVGEWYPPKEVKV